MYSPTPYGGRLSWQMPAGSPLVIHLKDCRKIRKKKRWSQVFYMHYLLHWIANQKAAPPLDKSFILTLDGDVHFLPESVHALLDDLQSGHDVAANCGRIHPIGSGPIAWYQKFEYAMGHWMNKETETVLGCILCTPGCFSMFKGTAIVDGDILRQYETITTNATHYLQRDQGEDRWLCTLLLQQGHRVVYTSSAKAHTFCPDNLEEFYKQRRRWTPTNLPNNMALLYNWRTTIATNKHITLTFILYMMLLTVNSAIDAGCIFLMMSSALNGICSPWQSVILNFMVLAVYTLICLLGSQYIQMLATKILSVVFAVLQAILLYILVCKVMSDGVHLLATIYLVYLVGVVILAGLVHPSELKDLIHGLTFFLLAPSLRLLLMIYVVTNIHVVSWGTREASTSHEDTNNNTKLYSQRKYMMLYQKLLRGRLANFISSFLRDCWVKVRIGSTMSNSNLQEMGFRQANTFRSLPEERKSHGQEAWMHDPLLSNAKMKILHDNEVVFLERLCKDHLAPIDESKMYAGFNLKKLRNWVTLGFCVTNALFVFVIINIHLYASNTSFTLYQGLIINVEPVSFLLFSSFVMTSVLQLVCMLIHKAQTLGLYRKI